MTPVKVASFRRTGQSRSINNGVESSHQPTNSRERQMKRFQSPPQDQRLLSGLESIKSLRVLPSSAQADLPKTPAAQARA
jgi:transposase-like protein